MKIRRKEGDVVIRPEVKSSTNGVSEKWGDPKIIGIV